MHRLRGYTGGTLWIWPSITVAVALLAGTLLSMVSTGPSPWLFRGDGSAGRTVLTALVGGLVTALSVVFSITIIGLQTVHSQYSPRLLRTFIQDLVAQMDRVVADALRIGDARAASEHADSGQLPVPPAGSHVVAATDTGYMQGWTWGPSPSWRSSGH